MTDLHQQHHQQRQRLIDKIKRELGKEIYEALTDPAVHEIQLNPDRKVFVIKSGQSPQLLCKMDAYSSLALIGSVAHSLNTTVTADNPIVEGEFPLDGSRFEGLIPPVVANPTFTIRKKALKIYTLDDYVKSGSMNTSQAEAIRKSIRFRKNILVVGGTASGKTTLLNAILFEISVLCPEDRLVIIEDTAELQCEADNVVIMRSTEHVSSSRLLKATLRLTPNRISFGEVRGGEALELLKAWNTGHPGGCCTVHANSAHEGLGRLEECIQEITAANFTRLIASAVNICVFIEKDPDTQKRVVTQILEVVGHANGTYQTRPVTDNIKPVINLVHS